MKTNPTLGQLQRLLPHAALELVIYTGWTFSEIDPDGPLIEWPSGRTSE